MTRDGCALGTFCVDAMLCVMHIIRRMRTHLQIIQDAGGYREFATKVRQVPARVRFWERRAAIPAEWWSAVAGAGLATLEELAVAAAAKRQPTTTPADSPKAA